MESVKEFLKPNKWKVAIWIFLAATYLFALFQGFPDLSGAKNRYFGLLGIPSSLVLLSLSVIITAGKITGLAQSLLLWGMLVIYWYLLACLVYFTFLRIKRSIAKPIEPQIQPENTTDVSDFDVQERHSHEFWKLVFGLHMGLTLLLSALAVFVQTLPSQSCPFICMEGVPIRTKLLILIILWGFLIPHFIILRRWTGNAVWSKYLLIGLVIPIFSFGNLALVKFSTFINTSTQLVTEKQISIPTKVDQQELTFTPAPTPSSIAEIPKVRLPGVLTVNELNTHPDNYVDKIIQVRGKVYYQFTRGSYFCPKSQDNCFDITGSSNFQSLLVDETAELKQPLDKGSYIALLALTASTYPFTAYSPQQDGYGPLYCSKEKQAKMAYCDTGGNIVNIEGTLSKKIRGESNTFNFYFLVVE